MSDHRNIKIFSQDDEPTVALVMGGRHPGHYFMDSDDFNDIVSRNKVEPLTSVMMLMTNNICVVRFVPSR